LAMNPGGNAYLAYRVQAEAGSNQNIIPGYLDMDTRVARYDGSLWSMLGSPADRKQSLPVRAPTAANSPKVGIDVAGNGLVAFQEPDESFVDRIWARRIFGTTFGVAPSGDFRTAYSSGSAALMITGSDSGVGAPAALGDGHGAVDPTPAVLVAKDDAAVLAWRARSSVPAVEELRPNGAYKARAVS